MQNNDNVYIAHVTRQLVSWETERSRLESVFYQAVCGKLDLRSLSGNVMFQEVNKCQHEERTMFPNAVVRQKIVAHVSHTDTQTHTDQ